MDGSFLELNSDEIVTEVDEFTKEIFKILKIFQTKLKKLNATRHETNAVVAATNKRKASMGMALHGKGDKGLQADVDLPPCVQVLVMVQGRIQEFKVCTICLAFSLSPHYSLLLKSVELHKYLFEAADGQENSIADPAMLNKCSAIG